MLWKPKPRTATLEELKQQLSEATTAQAEAQRAVESAQRAFDDDGAEASAKGLARAREAADLASEHVARAKRLLAAAEATKAAEDRAELERRRATIRSQVSDQTKDRELEAAEVRAFVAVVEARLARRRHNQRRFELESELLRLGTALGEPESPTYGYGRIEPGVVVVAEQLRDLSARETDQQRRAILFELSRLLAPGLR